MNETNDVADVLAMSAADVQKALDQEVAQIGEHETGETLYEAQVRAAQTGSAEPPTAHTDIETAVSILENEA